NRTKILERVPSVLFAETSAIALTEVGWRFVQTFARGTSGIDRKAFSRVSKLFQMGRLVPTYDANDRLFRWGVHRLKRFRQAATNQELVVKCAENEQWTEWFDSPLPLVSGTSRKRRAHNTVNDLNRRQRAGFVHFKMDGTGHRIGWELNECKSGKN